MSTRISVPGRGVQRLRRGVVRFRIILRSSRLHQDTARVLLLGGLVEHLALSAQVGGLGHKVVQFLATLKDLKKQSVSSLHLVLVESQSSSYAIDGLVQNNFGIVELLLDLGDAARFVGVLVVVEVILQRRERNVAVIVGRLDLVERNLGQELVHQL